MKNFDVLDIVSKYLNENGYDGLIDSDNECACLNDDLAPCGEISGTCRAGHKVLCTPECDHEGYDPDVKGCWHIQLEKPKKED